eukprot:3193588-Alexandrium_andersonii.AAC.1
MGLASAFASYSASPEGTFIQQADATSSKFFADVAALQMALEASHFANALERSALPAGAVVAAVVATPAAPSPATTPASVDGSGA